MATLTQPVEPRGEPRGGETRKMQLFLEEEAYLRLKLASARTKVPLGRIASKALIDALPALGEVG